MLQEPLVDDKNWAEFAIELLHVNPVEHCARWKSECSIIPEHSEEFQRASTVMSLQGGKSHPSQPLSLSRAVKRFLGGAGKCSTSHVPGSVSSQESPRASLVSLRNPRALLLARQRDSIALGYITMPYLRFANFYF